MVVADLRAVRDDYILVDDRPFNLGMPADGDILKENGVLHQAVAVHLAARAEYGPSHSSAAGYTPGADVGVYVEAAPPTSSKTVFAGGRFPWLVRIGHL